MFVPGEDFYFLAYTLLFALAELQSRSMERALYDSRKLAYVADLVGSDSDLRLVTTTAHLSQPGRARLALLYDRAVSRRAAVQRIVEALATRGIIGLRRAEDHTDRIHLLEEVGVKALLESSSFDAERQRVKVLRQIVPHLRTMTLATMKEKLFDVRGVRTWGE
jgi:hypothetical protein